MLQSSKFFILNIGIILSTNLFFDTSSKIKLTSDLRASQSNKLTFEKDTTIDGQGFFITFPSINIDVLEIEKNAGLTLENTVLENISPEHTKLGSNSKIIFGNNAIVSLLKNETLCEKWSFQGNSTLDGKFSTLTLAQGGEIVVQPYGILTLKNITISGLAKTNLRCTDNTAAIIFDCTEFINNGSWTFEAGYFKTKGYVSMRGGGTFVYTSPSQSIIDSNSTLFLSDGMTFSFRPSNEILLSSSLTGSARPLIRRLEDLQTNISFTDSSAKMWCDGVTLSNGPSGWRILKGSILFDRCNYIINDATTSTTNQALIFGDGTCKNDPNINIGPDAKLKVLKGMIRYESPKK